MEDFDFVTAAILYTVLLVSLVVHEAAHAVVALRLGDRTAYVGGQVTLNPIPHMKREPFGTVLLPIALLVFSGGKGIMGFAHIPVDPFWAARHPKRAAIMAAAGPLSNFLLALIAAVTLTVLVNMGHLETARGSVFEVFQPADGSTDGALYAVAKIGIVFVLLNLLLGMLNLLPWPPLDGASILGGFVPAADRFFAFVRSQPFLVLAGMIGIFFVVQDWIYPAFNLTFKLLGVW